jgi:hypothetical protein
LTTPNEETIMLRKRIFLHGLKFAALAAIAAALLGSVVMALWNALLPTLFAWPVIGFWQALGLFALSRLLVGGLRGGMGHRGRWRDRMVERWGQMSEEEREAFRSGMGRRCGGRRGEAGSAPTA